MREPRVRAVKLMIAEFHFAASGSGVHLSVSALCHIVVIYWLLKLSINVISDASALPAVKRLGSRGRNIEAMPLKDERSPTGVR